MMHTCGEVVYPVLHKMHIYHLLRCFCSCPSLIVCLSDWCAAASIHHLAPSRPSISKLRTFYIVCDVDVVVVVVVTVISSTAFAFCCPITAVCGAPACLLFPPVYLQSSGDSGVVETSKPPTHLPLPSMCVNSRWHAQKSTFTEVSTFHACRLIAATPSLEAESVVRKSFPNIFITILVMMVSISSFYYLRSLSRYLGTEPNKN